MRKEEFVEAIKDYASSKGEVVVEQINKGSRSYLGLFIKKHNVATPVLNLEALYEVYRRDGGDLDACYGVADRVLSMRPDNNIEEEIINIKNWEWSKERLIIRDFPKGEIEETGIFDEVDGYIMCPYVRLNDTMVVRVTPELVELWKVEVEEVKVIGALNSFKDILSNS